MSKVKFFVLFIFFLCWIVVGLVVGVFLVGLVLVGFVVCFKFVLFILLFCLLI